MTKKGQVKKKKLRLKVRVVVKLLLFLLIAGALFYYVSNLKIKNIFITGTTRVRDVEIIEKVGIQDYPCIYKLNLSEMKDAIKTIPLVRDVKIKRNLFGKLRIQVEEDTVLFFYKYNNKYITSSGASVEDTNDYFGYPTLINFTPDTIFEDFVKGLNKVDMDVILMINEIEYTPYKASDGQVIDNNRFTLKMNDTNTVIVDTVNMKNLNKYMTIFASPDMDKERGVVYLDTINDESIYFKSYETIAKEEEEKKRAQEEQDKEKKEQKEENN